MNHLRRIPMHGIYNIRDLGGYPIGFDKATGWGKIYRSDGLFNLCEEDKKSLQEHYGIKTVIDLRSTRELREEPNDFREHGQVRYYHIGIIPEENGTELLEADEWSSLANIYLAFVNKSTNQIKEVFKTIAAHLDTPIVYHCTAGKDRTGIISALLLALCGVNRFDIIADYEISFTLLQQNIDKVRDKDQPTEINYLTSVPDNMRGFLDFIEQQYQTVENFLIHCGIDKKELDKIKKWLIESL